MVSNYFRFAVIIILLMSTQIMMAQTAILEQIQVHYSKSQPQIDINTLEIRESHKDGNKQYYYIQQVMNNRDIYNAVSTVVVVQGNLFTSSANFLPIRAVNETVNRLDETQLINLSIQEITQAKIEPSVLSKSKKKGNYQSILSPAISSEELYYRQVYYPDIKGNLTLALEVNIWSNTNEQWYQYIQAADQSGILAESSWTVSCDFSHQGNCDGHHSTPRHNNVKSIALVTGIDSSYNVLGLPFESPVYSDRDIEVSPWNLALNASPYGWHDLDGVMGADTTVTYGNNVRAYEDIGNNNEPGIMPDGGTNLCFDFPFDDEMAAATYTDAATVNLFYWNNVIHDIMYQYGFTEDAGNFQQLNYTGLGDDNDHVNAESQDGSGTDNANFSTPPDGGNGRMQMFLWNIPRPNDSIDITSPPSIEGKYLSLGGAFGPTDVSVLDTLVLVDPITACDPIINTADIDGQIAVIDRGDCTFTDKVQAAQDAGAVAVIICNNQAGIISMGGSSTTITIPSVMISQADCNTIKAEIPTVVGEVSVSSPSLRDSDFDNGIIVHEYGHGISNRLTGGPSNTSCLGNQEQMGEGWSDYFGLMLTIEANDTGDLSRGIGNYVQGQDENGGGIRPFPYSTDFNVNPHTYDDIDNVSVPHGVGSVWCAMLWEMTWDLIDEYGYDSDIYNGTGGNNIALQLVMDGLKLQPCNPGFVDGRDAILLADQINNNGDNQCIIWKAFARRGLGFSADQGGSGSVDDGSEAFDLPPACQDILAVLKSTDEEVALSGDTLHYSLFGFNNTGMTFTEVIIEDELDSDLTYVNNSLSIGMESGGIITIPLADYPSGSETNVTFEAKVNALSTVISYYDPVEYDDSTWTPSTGQGTAAFTLSTASPHLDNQSWFIENVGADNTHYIESQDFTIVADDALSFYHNYDTESGWDGGFVEYSNDGGSTWTNLDGYFILNPYNSVIGTNQNADIAGQPGFTGDSGGYINSIVSLNHLDGETVRFRFVFGSDDNTFVHGWYIDDVSIYTVPNIYNSACITSAENVTYCDTVKTSILTDCNRFYKLYPDADGDNSGVATDSIYTCNLTPGYSPFKEDCDDNDPLLGTQNEDLCDGIDNNCNGLIDETCSGSLICEDGELILMVNDTKFNIAENKILSDALINQLDDTYYYAGDTITLNIGFEVELGKTFNAIIEDCAND